MRLQCRCFRTPGAAASLPAVALSVTSMRESPSEHIFIRCRSFFLFHPRPPDSEGRHDSTRDIRQCTVTCMLLYKNKTTNPACLPRVARTSACRCCRRPDGGPATTTRPGRLSTSRPHPLTRDQRLYTTVYAVQSLLVTLAPQTHSDALCTRLSRRRRRRPGSGGGRLPLRVLTLSLAPAGLPLTLPNISFTDLMM